jgi:hypothetical protein
MRIESLFSSNECVIVSSHIFWTFKSPKNNANMTTNSFTQFFNSKKLCEDYECEDNNKKIKAGDTMIQILLKTLEINKKFAHIKKLELSDTSKKSCYDVGIEL